METLVNEKSVNGWEPVEVITNVGQDWIELAFQEDQPAATGITVCS